MMPAASPSPWGSRVIIRSSREFSESTLASLWAELLRRRWIDAELGRVTVRAGKTWFLSVIEQTARSLVEYLDREAPAIQIVRSFPEEGRAMPRIRQADEGEVSSPPFDWQTRSCIWRAGVSVSSEWLLPGSLVTIAAPGPDRQLRNSSALAAQAELIRFSPFRCQAYRQQCLYEAHRLLRSDAIIVCGPLSRFHPQKGWFWIAGNSDVGVEAAVARAAGIKPEVLPQLRFLKKHETVDLDHLIVEGDLPRLEGYSASRLSAWTVRGSWKIRGRIMSVGDDLVRLRENLPRLRAAVRGRLAKRIKR